MKKKIIFIITILIVFMIIVPVNNVSAVITFWHSDYHTMNSTYANLTYANGLRYYPTPLIKRYPDTKNRFGMGIAWNNNTVTEFNATVDTVHLFLYTSGFNDDYTIPNLQNNIVLVCDHEGKKEYVNYGKPDTVTNVKSLTHATWELPSPCVYELIWYDVGYYIDGDGAGVEQVVFEFHARYMSVNPYPVYILYDGNNADFDGSGGQLTAYIRWDMNDGTKYTNNYAFDPVYYWTAFVEEGTTETTYSFSTVHNYIATAVDGFVFKINVESNTEGVGCWLLTKDDSNYKYGITIDKGQVDGNDDIDLRYTLSAGIYWFNVSDCTDAYDNNPWSEAWAVKLKMTIINDTTSDYGIMVDSDFYKNTDYVGFNVKAPAGTIVTGVVYTERQMEDYPDEHLWAFTKFDNNGDWEYVSTKWSPPLVDTNYIVRLYDTTSSSFDWGNWTDQCDFYVYDADIVLDLWCDEPDGKYVLGDSPVISFSNPFYYNWEDYYFKIIMQPVDEPDEKVTKAIFGQKNGGFTMPQFFDEIGEYALWVEINDVGYPTTALTIKIYADQDALINDDLDDDGTTDEGGDALGPTDIDLRLLIGVFMCFGIGGAISVLTNTGFSSFALTSGVFCFIFSQSAMGYLQLIDSNIGIGIAGIMVLCVILGYVFK